MWGSIQRISLQPCTFICCDLTSALTSYSENCPFEAVYWFLLMYRCILFFSKYIALLGYGITCSVYNCMARIEVLCVVVSILHLHVILQDRSSDSSDGSGPG